MQWKLTSITSLFGVCSVGKNLTWWANDKNNSHGFDKNNSSVGWIQTLDIISMKKMYQVSMKNVFLFKFSPWEVQMSVKKWYGKITTLYESP